MTAETIPPFSIAILVGGKSRRMKGADKLTLELAGRPVLSRALERLAPVRGKASEAFLVAKERARFEKFGLPVVPDSRETGGPLVGLITALAAAKADYVLVVAGDLPFASPEIAELLLSKCEGYDATIPMTGDMYEPLFAVYSKNCLEVFEKGLDAGTKKIIGLFDALKINKIPESDWRPLDPLGAAFLNINTPEDLARARSLLEK